jgi:tRNA nucleotidyltransferase (CCA-adding enzyme)
MIPENIRALMAKLHGVGIETRLAGGCVRDHLLGVEPQDFDLCTPCTPDQIIEKLRVGPEWLIDIIPTGIEHGTLTLRDRSWVPFLQVEITTLRLDHDTDGRHATVEFTTDWEADAARRDLTINAMMMDIHGNLYDWFGGQEDLARGYLCFVGDPELRVQEDYLRILRFFRFANKFSADGFKFHRKSREVCRMHKNGLINISVERIWAEISKILAGPNAWMIINEMDGLGILPIIGFPFRWTTMFKEVARRGGDPITIMASQFTFTHAAKEFAVEWKLSGVERDKLVWLVENEDFYDESLDRYKNYIARGINKDWVLSLMRLEDAPGINIIKAFEKPVFPVSGQDLIDLGMVQGQALGTALNNIKELWISSRFIMDKKQLLNRLTG